MLGLMIAFNLNWIYFDSEACRKFVHALRRHWLTAFAFTILHLPLSLALLLSGAAMNRLVISGTADGAGSVGETALYARAEEASTVPAGIYYFFGVGIGTSVICMATIGLLHKSMDSCKRRGILKLSRPFVIGTRYAMGVLMILLPVGHDHLTPLAVLGIYVGITAFLIAEETFSRLERSDREEDE
jgi:low temperature requirement protein LtrA